jgi:glycosyltransferase involved in cell wall biosynthesis
MAHGLPVVASAAGDIADLVEDGVSGRVLPAPTPESMADALEQVTVTGSRRRWREAAAARAARFDARRMASDYAELFRWATRPAPPVPFRVQPPTRISRIISRLNVGGPAIHVVLLTSRLQGAQWRSSLIAGSVGHSEGDMSYLAAQHGVTPALIPELGRAVEPHRDALSFWKLLRLLWIETPDVVHTHASKAGTLGRLAALLCNTLSRRSARCVIVHTYHGHTFTGYFRPPVAFAFRTIERLLARITDAVIVLSEGQRQEIVTVHNIAPPAKTHVVPLGLELDRFLGVDQALRIRARRRFGWEEDRKVVLTPGRLTGVKNHSLLVNAFARAARHDGRLHLVFAGDGELRGEILELVEQLGIWSRFELLGWQRDMASLYAAADLVVLPSLNEGTPVVLIESIASGCPVVASRVGGVPDVVDQSCGILVASGDVAELSAAIPRALRLGRLSRDTRQLMLRYSIDRLVLDLSELYSRLLDARRKAGVTAGFS